MAIVRIERTSGFTVVPNHIWTDPRISLKAKGALGVWLSKPDEWCPRSDWLARIGPDGREACRAANAELQRAGYLLRQRMQGADGQWDTITVIHDTPLDPVPEIDVQGYQGTYRRRETRSPVNAEAGVPDALTTTEQQTLSSKGRKTLSSSPRRRSARREIETDPDQSRLDTINQQLRPGTTPLPAASDTRPVTRKRKAPEVHVHQPRGRKPEHLACYWAVALERVGSLEAKEEQIVTFHFRRWLEMGLTPSLAKQMVDAFFADPKLVSSNRRWQRFVKNVELLRNRVSQGGQERKYTENTSQRLPEWAREAMKETA